MIETKINFQCPYCGSPNVAFTDSIGKCLDCNSNWNEDHYDSIPASLSLYAKEVGSVLDSIFAPHSSNKDSEYSGLNIRDEKQHKYLDQIYYKNIM